MVWYSASVKCRPRPREGGAKIHALACGLWIEVRRLLSLVDSALRRSARSLLSTDADNCFWDAWGLGSALVMDLNPSLALEMRGCRSAKELSEMWLLFNTAQESTGGVKGSRAQAKPS